jgi:hypothetical protein
MILESEDVLLSYSVFFGLPSDLFFEDSDLVDEPRYLILVHLIDLVFSNKTDVL